MQSISLFLLQNKIDVYTGSSSNWSNERFNRVYNRNLKIYRSVDNRIDLQIRNSDQKATDISESVLVFNLVTRAGVLILTRDCTVHNLTTGKVFVTISTTDMLELEQGTYSYSVIQEVRQPIDIDSYQVVSRTPMYVDSQYGTMGTIEVAGDLLGNVQPSTVITTFSYVNPIVTGVAGIPYYISSHIDAQPLTSTTQSVHTFQFYITNYRGTITIQGSVEAQGATPSTWVDIAYIDPLNDQYKNIIGKWSWFRIKHVPVPKNPAGATELDRLGNTGTIDKILYR